MRARLGKATLPSGETRLALILDTEDGLLYHRFTFVLSEAIRLGQMLVDEGKRLDAGIVLPDGSAWRPEPDEGGP